MVAVSAPGKLILMGEHAAVYGLPALTTALGLRVRASLTNGAAAGVDLDLPDVGYRGTTAWEAILRHAASARRRWQAFADGGAFERDDDPAAVVRVALGEAARELGGEPPPPLELRVDSELPVGAGFGSSAAVAVAVVAGFLAWRGVDPDPALVGRLALEAERRQHGKPSGVDHGTVLRGGVQWASRGADGELRLEPVAVRAGRLDGLRIFHTGPPAESTGAVVAAVASRRDRDPQRFDLVLARMEAATVAFRAQLESATGGDRPAALVREFESCLEELGVVPAAVRREVRRLEAAGAAGGAAKISGAGSLSGAAAGCLLVCPDPGGAWRPRPGWRRLDCPMGAPGLRLEAS